MKIQMQKKASGRKCKLKGCTQVLTGWNPNEYCFAHLHVGLRQDQLKDERIKDRKYEKKKKKSRVNG